MYTIAAINAAKPKEKAYKLAPAERCLYLFVKPNGSKLWKMDIRFEGKRNTLSFGNYPDLSLAQAREKRDEAHRMMASGIYPSEVKKAQKLTSRNINANSFEVVAREWIASHMSNKAPSHRDRTLRRFEVYLFSWIGNRAVSEITAPELLECIKRIHNQNKLETAHRVLQSAGQVYRYAVQTGRALRDVTADLKGALPSARVKHMAAFTEPDQLASFLRAIDGFKGTFTVQTALKLAPLVFVRPSELRTARWKDIDLLAGEWKYRVSKTKTDHLVPLSRQAIELLRSIYPFSGDGDFVFVGGHDPKKPMSDAAINASLKRMGYNTQTEITGHGFRATARTMLHERLGMNPEVIEHQLAHNVPDALGKAYNRTKFIQQRKEMMQKWADYLDELKAGEKVI